MRLRTILPRHHRPISPFATLSLSNPRRYFVSLPEVGVKRPPNTPMPGLYRHYKHGDTYKVLGTVLHTETSESMILYQATKPDKERNPYGLAFVRPSTMFMGTVEHKGTQVPRFQWIGSLGGSIGSIGSSASTTTTTKATSSSASKPTSSCSYFDDFGEPLPSGKATVTRTASC